MLTATPTNINDEKVVIITTVPLTTTITKINNATQIIAQRPATNENLIITPSLDELLSVTTVLTKQSFTNIIREYSSNKPAYETTKFILSNSLQPRIQYRTD